MPKLQFFRTPALSILASFALALPFPIQAEDSAPATMDSTATQHLKALKAKGITQLGNVKVTELLRHAASTKWVGIYGSFITGSAGSRITASHVRGEGIVYFNMTTLEWPGSLDRLPTMTLHEVLGASGFDDETYAYSMAIEDIATSSDPQRISFYQDFFNDFRILTPEEISRLERAPLEKDGGGGGSSGVGGGGDDIGLDLKRKTASAVGPWLRDQQAAGKFLTLQSKDLLWAILKKGDFESRLPSTIGQKRINPTELTLEKKGSGKNAITRVYIPLKTWLLNLYAAQYHETARTYQKETVQKVLEYFANDLASNK